MSKTNLNPSPDQNHLLDDSGVVVAEFISEKSVSRGDTCYKCVFFDGGVADCGRTPLPTTCSPFSRKDGKNGYWKEIESNE